MKTFLFKPSTIVKGKAAKKWWIDNDIIPITEIKAENLPQAMKSFKEHAEKNCVNFSQHAMEHKAAMYVDDENGNPKQIGYVLTGSTDFYDERDRAHKGYVEVWTTIKEVRSAF